MKDRFKKCFVVLVTQGTNLREIILPFSSSKSFMCHFVFPLKVTHLCFFEGFTNAPHFLEAYLSLQAQPCYFTEVHTEHMGHKEQAKLAKQFTLIYWVSARWKFLARGTNSHVAQAKERNHPALKYMENYHRNSVVMKNEKTSKTSPSG